MSKIFIIHKEKVYTPKFEQTFEEAINIWIEKGDLEEVANNINLK